ncbi:MAG TPA: sulfite exporter TauE/SafE family protein [Jatrophihabitans sp.]|nr:sulfite exporter TauE/SafE family protein [Jatrophihabitans sp.]
MDWTLALAALAIGVVVGLTGMGGGALMTPVLVLFFNVPPLSAVSSDLVASAVMRPVGAIVHLRNGNVRMDLVRWLAIGSVPAAFSGVLIARAMGDGSGVENVVQKALGAALVIAAVGLFVRSYMRLAERAAHRDGRRTPDPHGPPDIQVRPVATAVIGAVGGVVVGLTSVGSGSLIIISLMYLYPTLRASSLVGTDLMQAVPLVASAALGHLLFGELDMSITWALLVGSIPGAWIGAQLSSRLPGALIRRVLAFVLLASALKLFEVPTTLTLVALGVMAVLAGPIWMGLRRAHGFPALPSQEREQSAAAGASRRPAESRS